jgi:hypothetical protein
MNLRQRDVEVEADGPDDSGAQYCPSPIAVGNLPNLGWTVLPTGRVHCTRQWQSCMLTLSPRQYATRLLFRKAAFFVHQSQRLLAYIHLAVKHRLHFAVITSLAQAVRSSCPSMRRAKSGEIALVRARSFSTEPAVLVPGKEDRAC